MGEWGSGPASIALPLCQWPCRLCDDCQDVVGSVGKTFQMRLSRWPHRADPELGSGLRGFGARGVQPSAGCGGASPRLLRGCQRRADCRGEAGAPCRRHSRLRGVKLCETEDVVPAGALCRFAWAAACPSRLTISETARWWRTRALACPDPLVVAAAT